MSDNFEKTKAWAVATRDDFALRAAKARAGMEGKEWPSVLAGKISDKDLMWITYTTSHYLYESPCFLPYMMMHLPREQRWVYVKRFEVALATLVCSAIGGKILAVSEGNEPGYDLIIETDEGVQKTEIKSTEKHAIFIEGGRYDMSASGLSLTESDIYLIVSRDQQMHPDGTFSYVGKVRAVFTYQLVEEYMRIAGHSERVFLPDANGPGSRGVKMDMKKEDIPHVWIGDIACKVDQYGNTVYDTSAFVRQPATENQARAQFNKGVRLMEKFDCRQEELE
jgi:hypothetical protein